MINGFYNACDLCAYENNEFRGIYCNYFKEKLVFTAQWPDNYDPKKPQDFCVGFIMLSKMKKHYRNENGIDYNGDISNLEL